MFHAQNQTKSNHSRLSSYGFSLPSIKNLNAEFNPKQLTLLRTITKHTILASTAIIFYQLALLFGVLQKLLFKVKVGIELLLIIYLQWQQLLRFYAFFYHLKSIILIIDVYVNGCINVWRNAVIDLLINQLKRDC